MKEMTPQNITNIIYVVLLIAAFACEQFHIVPVGTANVVMALVTGHAVGTNVNVPTNAPSTTSSNQAATDVIKISTPDQG